MRSEKFDDILDQCLSMLQAGASIDDCVAPYPEHAEALHAQLRIVQTLRNARPQVQPQPPAQAQGRARLLAAVAEQRQATAAKPTLGLLAPLWALFGGVRRLALLPRAVPALLAILVLGGAAVGVSAATGQGPLGALLTPDSAEDVTELHGTVTAVDCAAGTLTIDDMPVLITDDTDFHGLSCEDIDVGMLLTVEATEDGGILTAREIEPEEAAADDADEPQDDDDIDEEGGVPGDGTDEDADDDGDDDAPANAEDGEGDDEDADHSGSGDAEDGEGGDEDDDADHSGPGNAEDGEGDDDDADHSGPGNAEDGEGDDDDADHSGPGDAEDHDDDDEGEDSSDPSDGSGPDDTEDHHDDEEEDESGSGHDDGQDDAKDGDDD